jgi:DNA topoisomerase 6 subunit A-like protein
MSKFTSPSDAILGLTASVTKEWTKQRKAEERNANAAANRRSRLIRSQRVTIREAAFWAMEEAYDKASAGRTLPVNPRQIYYAARRSILASTGRDMLDSGYFLQVLLPDFMDEHDCSHWDLIWDARGHFEEPHTARVVPIGTLQVRQYVGDRPKLGDPVQIDPNALYPTKGPEHRYNTVLFVEKEGFDPIFEAAGIAKRFDVALMSTKGMSTTAARLLLDRLVDRGVEKVLVLHDFDISGFSIRGTLGTDSGRYVFYNTIPIIDIGLRLSDVDKLDLLSEPFNTNKNPDSVADTLKRHGATQDEVDFLVQESHRDGLFGARVELNAMTSDELIDFVEGKFEEHGVTKIIPDDEVLELHARRMLERHLVLRRLEKLLPEIREQVANTALPDDLRKLVEERLDQEPELPWDAVVAEIIGDTQLDDEKASEQ